MCGSRRYQHYLSEKFLLAISKTSNLVLLDYAGSNLNLAKCYIIIDRSVGSRVNNDDIQEDIV